MSKWLLLFDSCGCYRWWLLKKTMQNWIRRKVINLSLVWRLSAVSLAQVALFLLLHSSEFRDTQTKVFLLNCHLYSVITHGIRLIPHKSLPTDEEIVISSLAQVYRKVPSEITFSILHHIRNAFGHSLQNYCVRCLKKNLSRNDLTKNRTVCGKRVSDVNIANEPRLYDITH